MMEKNDANEPFVLDERSLAQRLDILRAYGQSVPIGSAKTWAQVLFGQKATVPGEAATLEWNRVRQRCIDLYNDPTRADGTLPPEQAFLLALLGILEAPRAVFNQFPERYRDLYYRDLLGLKPSSAKADHLVVQWDLADSVRELEITADQCLDAGQDSQGRTLVYKVDRPIVVNHARWTDLRWCAVDRTRLGVRRAYIAFDATAGIEWPTGGVSLDGAIARESTLIEHDVRSTRVIGSSLLAIAGGQREWTLTFESTVSSLEAAVSIDNVWHPLCSKSNETMTMWTVTLMNGIGEPTPVSDLDGLNADTPLLRLRRTDAGNIAPVRRIELTVTDATDVHCVTDDGDEIQAGLPFGASASAGRSINFMASDWVRLGPQLKSITITPVWLGLPTKSFLAWYADYKRGEVFEESRRAFTGNTLTASDYDFRVNIDLKVGIEQSAASQCSLSLFDKGESGKPTGAPLKLPLDGYRIPAAMAAPDSTVVADWPWHVRLTLSRSFHDELYRRHLMLSPGYTTTSKMVESSAITIVDGKEQTITQMSYMPTTEIFPPSIWNEPYIPQWQSVRVDYTANDDVIATQLVRTPFGWTQDDMAYRGSTTDVYLGVDAIEPNQLLSVYWLLKSPGAIENLTWEYLARGERWVRLGAALSDETGNWARSGLWSVIWPNDAIRNAAGMPAGRYWLRARIPLSNESGARATMHELPRLIGLATNASVATLIDPQTVASTHLVQPLPAGAITHAINPPDGVLQAIQPWPSVGGRAAQTACAFNDHVARRLRHRGRALDTWDLVTLLCDHDTGIREVVVCEQARREGNKNNQARDGTLPQMLVVMPKTSANDGKDPLHPVYSKAHLKGLENWLRGRISPWLSIACQNPCYRRIPISWKITYREGISPSYGDQRVRNALEYAFRPWLSVETTCASVIGKPLTRRRVRECILQVADVERLEKLWIDGDDGTWQFPGGYVKRHEIAVIDCVPLAYHYVGIVVNIDTVGAVDTDVIRLSPGSSVQVTVSVDKNATAPSLYDVDTGIAIPLTKAAASFEDQSDTSLDSARTAIGIYCQKIEGLSEPSFLQFEVTVPQGQYGIYRIGVAWNIDSNTLLSGTIGQWITIEVFAPLTEGVPAVSQPTSVSVIH